MMRIPIKIGNVRSCLFSSSDLRIYHIISVQRGRKLRATNIGKRG
jgi:hypothetical protein